MSITNTEEAAVSEIDPRAEEWGEDAGEAAEEEWTGEPGMEAPEADAMEQRAAVGTYRRDLPADVPDEANEADATDQRLDVDLDDEDDYR